MDTETEKKRKRDEKPKHTKFEDSNSTNSTETKGTVISDGKKKIKKKNKKQKIDPAKLQTQVMSNASSNWQQLQQKIAPPTNKKKTTTKFFRKKQKPEPSEKDPKVETPKPEPPKAESTDDSKDSEAQSEPKVVKDTKVVCLVCNISPDVDPSTNTKVATSVAIYNYHAQPLYKVDVTRENRNQVTADVERLLANHVVTGYDLVKAIDALFMTKDKGTYLRDCKTYNALHFPEDELPLGKLGLKHLHRDEDIRSMEVRAKICLDLYKMFKSQWEVDIQKQKEAKRKMMQEMQKEFGPKKKERTNYTGKIFVNKKPYMPKQRKIQ